MKTFSRSHPKLNNFLCSSSNAKKPNRDEQRPHDPESTFKKKKLGKLGQELRRLTCELTNQTSTVRHGEWHPRRGEEMPNPSALRLQVHGFKTSGPRRTAKVTWSCKPKDPRQAAEKGVAHQSTAKRGLRFVGLDEAPPTDCRQHPDAAREATERLLRLHRFLPLVLRESHLHEEGNSGAVNAVPTGQ